MNSVILIVAIVILIIAVVLFLKKPTASGGLSEADLQRLREDNNHLQINLAKAEERATGLSLERDKADKLLQDERVRHDNIIAELNKEINIEKNRMAKAGEEFK